MGRRAELKARVRQRLGDVFGREVPGRELVGREALDAAEPGGPAPGAHGPIPPAAAFDPGRRGMRALAVFAALVICAAALVAWQARPRLEAVTAADSPAPSAAGPQPSVAGVVVVAVSGRVRRPGLVRLPAGARVADAIEAAGGALPDTDLSLVNLARKVSDGELVTVGISPPAGGAPGGAGTPFSGTAAGGKVNLNTATLTELDALPGVGPVLAQRIIDHRQRHGGFRSVNELTQVDGVGDTRYQELKDLVTV